MVVELFRFEGARIRGVGGENLSVHSNGVYRADHAAVAAFDTPFGDNPVGVLLFSDGFGGAVCGAEPAVGTGFFVDGECHGRSVVGSKFNSNRILNKMSKRIWCLFMRACYFHFVIYIYKYTFLEARKFNINAYLLLRKLGFP